MRHILSHYIVLLLIATADTFAQNPLSGVVVLKVEQFEEDGQRYSSSYPKIQAQLPGKKGALMNKYHRRFEYVLQNKTRFQGLYDSLYPDTVKISARYIHEISSDIKFMGYFNELAQALDGSARVKTQYTAQELMHVASKFFYCNRVKPDSTVDAYICVALNGVPEANWKTDYTVLESFCFEAIFENIKTKDGRRSDFVDNFVNYRKEGERNFKASVNEPDVYLKSVRDFCFKKMAADADLRSVLMNYYTSTRQTLPFEIK